MTGAPVRGHRASERARPDGADAAARPADRFIDHGDPAVLLSQCGLDAAGIEHAITERFINPPTTLRTVVNG